VEGSYQIIDNDNVVTYSQMIKYNQKKYLVSFWDNGIIKSYIPIIVWGVKHGESSTWDESGKVNGQGSYILGIKHGVWKEGTQKTTFMKETYFWGYKHGLMTLSRNDFVFHTSEYRWGKQHGTSMGYNKILHHGQVSDIIHYKRGLKHGEYRKYPGDSEFYYMEEGYYRYDIKHGNCIKIDDNRKTLERTRWCRGVKHGPSQEYDKESKLTGVGNYKYGYRQGKWFWYDKGREIKEETFNDWKELDVNEKRYSRIKYRENNIIRYWLRKLPF